MKDMVKRTIEVLKEKVRGNLIDIQNNQIKIRELLRQPVSAERSSKLEELYANNKTLLADNNDFINVQLTLVSFLEKHGKSDIFETKGNVPCTCISENDCFEKTVSGMMTFNTQHPYYSDDNFFHKLMKYYQDVEDYESCDKLIKEKEEK